MTAVTAEGMRFVLQTQSRRRFTLDEPLDFGFRAGELYFFDPEHELAIGRA